MNIKPLPTIYNNQEFRSSLEARWALYFDLIGAEWVYEPDAYKLPSGNYLPDFLVSDKVFVEVKPDSFEAINTESKLEEFAKELRLSDKLVTCVYGAPGPSPFSFIKYCCDCEEDCLGNICNYQRRYSDCLVFCAYAYKQKVWGEPYYGGSDIHWEDADSFNAHRVAVTTKRSRQGILVDRIGRPITHKLKPTTPVRLFQLPDVPF